MPRTKKQTNKRARNNDDDAVRALKQEVLRVHEEGMNEMNLRWQSRKEQIADIFQKFRCGFTDEEMEMTMAEYCRYKATKSELLQTEANASVASKLDDDGYVTEASNRSSKPAKLLPATTKKTRHRRSKSAGGNINLSTASARPLSRLNSFSGRPSRSKLRTPANRLQTMSADRSIITPITPKIQVNTPVSLLRYPKIGETVISMSGSPVIVNGGSQQGVANINIPIKDGMLSMQPNAITDVDTDLVERIDKNTMRQLKQLQENLAKVMSTIQNKK